MGIQAIAKPCDQPAMGSVIWTWLSLYSSLLLPWERLISSIARHAGAMAFVCVGGGGG